ncbi:hypothetical protein GCM10022288_31980 [Gryllotalpicola kribbensis]|uniref:Uncharacterized protein n=1 Tax=Gryllotalpicola kribbensis TaxID=993084 RepID=A0ABP8B0V9_9MICO
MQASRQESVERAGKLYAPDDIRPIDVVALMHGKLARAGISGLDIRLIA